MWSDKKRDNREDGTQRQRQTQSDTGEGLRRIQLCGPRHHSNAVTNWRGASQPESHGRLPSHREATRTTSGLMSEHHSLSPSLIQDNWGETFFENHTATMLLNSSALKRRLNKAVKKLIPLGRHACKHTDPNTWAGGYRKFCLMFLVPPLVLLSLSLFPFLSPRPPLFPPPLSLSPPPPPPPPFSRSQAEAVSHRVSEWILRRVADTSNTSPHSSFTAHI